MASNVGKDFEQQFRKCVPNYCAVIRIPDPPQSFIKSNETRFSNKNPFDYVIYDSKSNLMYCLELKTTKYKSMSFDIDGSDDNKMIHKHQIDGLNKYKNFKGIVSAFIFNFRDEKNNMERTYFQNINDFNHMISNIGKKSFNELDLLNNNVIKISGIKKRIRYTWDIEELFSFIGYNMEV